MDPPPGLPLEDRYRGAEFYLEGDTLYLYSSGARDPRVIVWATAKVDPDDVASPEPSNARATATESTR